MRIVGGSVEIRSAVEMGENADRYAETGCQRQDGRAVAKSAEKWPGRPRAHLGRGRATTATPHRTGSTGEPGPGRLWRYDRTPRAGDVARHGGPPGAFGASYR
jgi:hypothetical protein